MRITLQLVSMPELDRLSNADLSGWALLLISTTPVASRSEPWKTTIWHCRVLRSNRHSFKLMSRVEK
jgi:hypothetical protein